MVSYFIGAALMAVIFLCIFLGIVIGMRFRKKQEIQKVDELANIEMERRKKGFENIMNYDYDQALGRVNNV